MIVMRALGLCIAIFYAGLLQAHEFWLEAQDYTVSPGDSATLDLRVGQSFGGSAFPFVQQRFRSLTVTVNDATVPYQGRAGDLPAIKVEEPANGLNILAYHSKVDTLRFTEARPDLLERYLVAEGLEAVLEQHRAEGLPEIGFKEEYTRNAKALVQVGPYSGDRDQAVGLPFELVVVGSPYDGRSAVELQLLWQGMPTPNYPINVFTKTNEVVQTRVYTNESGQASVEFPENSRLLLNSVWIQRKAEESGALYESWWASTTFGR